MTDCAVSWMVFASLILFHEGNFFCQPDGCDGFGKGVPRRIILGVGKAINITIKYLVKQWAHLISVTAKVFVTVQDECTILGVNFTDLLAVTRKRIVCISVVGPTRDDNIHQINRRIIIMGVLAATVTIQSALDRVGTSILLFEASNPSVFLSSSLH